MHASILPKNHGECLNFDFLGHFVIFRAQNEFTLPFGTEWVKEKKTCIKSQKAFAIGYFKSELR